MAEIAALAGLRWVASPIVNKLLFEASTYLGVDMARELQDLETTVLPQFELMIEAAENSPYKDKLKAWLQRLKGSYYDTEDLLDEHEYNLLKRRVKSGKDPSLGDDANFIKSTILKPFRAVKSKAANLLPENRRLISKMQELKAVLAEARHFRDLLGLPAGVPATSAPVATTTSLPTSKVFGRDKDCDDIVDILLSNTIAASYSSLAIVGEGGMGKSTLAQYVYNDKRIEEYFDLRMWVSISRKLDVRRHTREIIESGAKVGCPSVDSLDTLQCKLKEMLQSKKCLLVLDDVWFQESNNNETEWQQLLAPLVDHTESKVLVTSRRSTFPGALFCEQVLHLDSMNDSEFLALLKHHAFSGAQISDQVLQKKLEEIAEQIAKKLGQSPLAAQVMGYQLSRKKNVTAWRDALRINNLNEPMRVLLWSYEKLDPRLQRCFSYCSLFPKGHKFEIDELVQLWVAEGFIDSCNLSKTVEDIGKDYFNEMVSGCFFQQSKTFYDSWYIMHDLLHDLAGSLSIEDCFRLEDDNVTKIPCTVRHLSVRVESMTKHKQIISGLRHLRTIICIDPLIDDVDDIFHQILKNLKKLRVLYLSCYNNSKLPESVGDLKHLRYLNLMKTFISEVPRSLGNLYHLKLLRLNYKVKSLPDEVCNNLSKLRHLEGFLDGWSYMSVEVHPQIPNIGKLTSLQKLYEFSVQKKKGHELRQLMDMNELGGSLHIKNLENVTGKIEALESKLHLKSHLKQLRLEWSSKDVLGTQDSVHLEVLEGLVPPSQLEGLVIDCYQSATYPCWLLDGSYLENLECFGLVDCSVVEGLPPDTKLFRNCQSLLLRGAQNLKMLPCLPEVLKNLTVDRCPLLMFVANDEQEQHDLRENITWTGHLVSQLVFLWEVNSKSYVKVLSEEHSSLKQLMTLIDDDISKHLQFIKTGLEEERDEISVKEDIIKAWLCCHQQRLKLICGRSIGQGLIPPSGLCELDLSACSITDKAFAICLSRLNSLTSLSLQKIMTLSSLPSEEVFQHLSKLDRLKIAHCWCLRSLGGLRAAISLSKIYILFCPSLKLARGSRFMPLSLESLHICGCVLPSDIFYSELPNLKYLYIFTCRSSESLLVGHLPSLESLLLYRLPDLCMLEGLSTMQLDRVELIDVPKLTAKCILRFRVKRQLYVSSSEFLNLMLSADGFTVPPVLTLKSCKESTISFEESANLSSVKILRLDGCEMKSLPTNMECLTGLERLSIHHCPNILSLPDLPSSLQHISISGCEALKEKCRAPDGECWPKIVHIRWKDFN